MQGWLLNEPVDLPEFNDDKPNCQKYHEDFRPEGCDFGILQSPATTSGLICSRSRNTAPGLVISVSAVTLTSERHWCDECTSWGGSLQRVVAPTKI
eukprot:3294998-Rhodomonas_salina.5